MKKVIQLSALATVLLATTSTIACKSSDDKKDSKEQSSSTPSSDGYRLKFQLKPGTSFSFENDIKQTIEASGSNTSNNIFTKYTFNTSTSTDANTKIEVMYDEMTMEMSLMGQSMKMGSKEQNEESKIFRDIINKPFSMIVSPEGKVLKVEGFENIDKSGTLKADDMKQSMETSFNIYPDKPVKVGDTWKKEANMNMQMFKMNISTTYTLKAVKDNVATINLNSEIAMSPDAGQNEVMKMNISGTQKGDLEVDMNTGMPLKGNIIQDITGEIEAQGKKMPMKINSDIKMTGKQTK